MKSVKASILDIYAKLENHKKFITVFSFFSVVFFILLILIVFGVLKVSIKKEKKDNGQTGQTKKQEEIPVEEFDLKWILSLAITFILANIYYFISLYKNFSFIISKKNISKNYENLVKLSNFVEEINSKVVFFILGLIFIIVGILILYISKINGIPGIVQENHISSGMTMLIVAGFLILVTLNKTLYSHKLKKFIQDAADQEFIDRYNEIQRKRKELIKDEQDFNKKYNDKEKKD